MLLDICKDKEFPSRRTVQRWVRSEPEFAYQYDLPPARWTQKVAYWHFSDVGKCPT